MNELTVIQKSWLGLAQKSQMLKDSLQAKELKLQMLCKTHSNDYKTIDGIIATYDKELKVMIAERMQFTSIIQTNLIDPVMVFEKRAKEFEGYHSLKSKSLELRKAAENDSKRQSAIIEETADFKAHIQNEWKRIESDYVIALSKHIDSFFAQSLEANEQSPDLTKLWSIMDAQVKPAPVKFSPVNLTREQMLEINKEIPAPDFKSRLMESKQNAKALFDNHYKAALANKDAAIEQIQKDAAAKEAAIKREAEKTQAVNVLIAKAESHSAVVQAPKIKRDLVPVVEESPKWALGVIMQFVRLEADLWKHIRVKSYANLTVDQMAKALAKYHAETGEVIDGVQFTEIEK
jgi:hypothetical protein